MSDGAEALTGEIPSARPVDWISSSDSDLDRVGNAEQWGTGRYRADMTRLSLTQSLIGVDQAVGGAVVAVDFIIIFQLGQNGLGQNFA